MTINFKRDRRRAIRRLARAMYGLPERTPRGDRKVDDAESVIDYDSTDPDKFGLVE